MKMSLLETMSAWFLNPSSERRFFVKLLDNRSHFLFQGLYYGASICLVSFASAMAVVTLNIHYRGLRGGSVPPWIRTIALGYLAKYVHNVYVFGTHDHHELCFHYFYEWQHQFIIIINAISISIVLSTRLNSKHKGDFSCGIFFNEKEKSFKKKRKRKFLLRNFPVLEMS